MKICFLIFWYVLFSEKIYLILESRFVDKNNNSNNNNNNDISDIEDDEEIDVKNNDNNDNKDNDNDIQMKEIKKTSNKKRVDLVYGNDEKKVKYFPYFFICFD